MSMLLFIDGCISASESRTKSLCQVWLNQFMLAHPASSIETFDLRHTNLLPLNSQRLTERNKLIRAQNYSDPSFEPARQFISAEHILIGVPFWDMSFPSALKIYIENIMISGLTFYYDEKGPHGLCKAQSLTYITSSGSPIPEGQNLGYQYICAIAKMLSIPETQYFSAEGIDIIGNDVEAIMHQTRVRIMNSFLTNN